MKRVDQTELPRVLTLPLVILYGLGVTIGAGIYVLIGETTGRAGMLAPFSFLTAAAVMVFPALCFAELAGRFPFASGAAQYVEEGFGSRATGLIVGVMMIFAGLVAASTISLGSVRYMGELVALPPWILLLGVVGLMGFISAWGIKESVIIIGVMTLLEVVGLLAIIVGGFVADPALLSRISTLAPVEWNGIAAISIVQAAMLAFFAFIGFEGIANVAEETSKPQTTLPRAILITLTISTVIYLLVVGVALLSVGPTELLAQRAPLSFIFEKTTGLPAAVISLIAVVSTMNGVVVQIIMVSRLTYGLSSRGLIPAFFGIINGKTRTPIVATAVAVIAVLVLSFSLPITTLAELTSRIILFVFALVCAALLRLKFKGTPVSKASFVVHVSVPVIGTILCLALLFLDLVT